MQLFLLLLPILLTVSITHAGQTSGTLYRTQTGHEGLADADISSAVQVANSRLCLQQCQLTAGCAVASFQPELNTCSLAEGTVHLVPKAHEETVFMLPDVAPPITKNTVPDVPTTDSSGCTQPFITANTSTPCNVPGQLYSVKAAMRLHSNRAVLFLPDGKLLICDNLDDVKDMDANPCTKMQFYGTMNLDPIGQFPEGPDAAVEYTPAIEADSYYYLFKDDKVYCFAHRAASPYFSRSCFWDSMSITARFGAGIPSNLDTAIGSHGTWVFYFTKDNMVYTSSGDENNGTLTSMEPLDANMFSKQPCNSAAAMEGASGNEFYYFKGEDHYFTSSPSELYLNGQICWG